MLNKICITESDWFSLVRISKTYPISSFASGIEGIIIPAKLKAMKSEHMMSLMSFYQVLHNIKNTYCIFVQ